MWGWNGGNNVGGGVGKQFLHQFAIENEKRIFLLMEVVFSRFWNIWKWIIVNREDI